MDLLKRLTEIGLLSILALKRAEKETRIELKKDLLLYAYMKKTWLASLVHATKAWDKPEYSSVFPLICCFSYVTWCLQYWRKQYSNVS